MKPAATQPGAKISRFCRARGRPGSLQRFTPFDWTLKYKRVYRRRRTVAKSGKLAEIKTGMTFGSTYHSAQQSLSFKCPEWPQYTPNVDRMVCHESLCVSHETCCQTHPGGKNIKILLRARLAGLTAAVCPLWRDSPKYKKIKTKRKKQSPNPTEKLSKIRTGMTLGVNVPICTTISLL